MLSNIWVWDPGSEIRDPEKTHSGSRIQGSKRHGIRIRITVLMDPDPDPGGPKTYGSSGSGSATLLIAVCRLFAAFLDHGPQFVLRLVIVVLNGIAHNGVYHRGGGLFIFQYSLLIH
jgi:hypothetical protein